MKRFVLTLLVVLSFVVVIHAQDAVESDSDQYLNIVVQNFGEGEFVETDEANVFTLTLASAEDLTEILVLEPFFGFRNYQTSIFQIGLASMEDLSLEALLVVGDQQISMTLSNFSFVDLETVQFTAEITEVVATLDGAGLEMVGEFEDGQLYLYFDTTLTESLNAALMDASAQVRENSNPPPVPPN